MPTPLTSAIARTYPANSQQVSAVRADLRAWLGTCAELDDVILCASELATNAIIHSRSGELGGSITVTADLCSANCLVDRGLSQRLRPIVRTAWTSWTCSPASGASTTSRSVASSGPSWTGRAHERPQ
jgi:hypothetical protein